MIMELSRLLVLVGLGIAAVGLLVWGISKIGLPLGRLPGDITWRKGNTTVCIPIVSSLVVSVLGSLLFSAFRRWRRGS
jgi:hypothetical protein